MMNRRRYLFSFLSIIVTINGLAAPLPNRRDTLKSLGTVLVSTSAAIHPAIAADKPEVVEYKSEVDKFSLAIPSSWKIVTKDKDGQSGKLFTAIDLQSGSVVTVVRERACEMKIYIEQPERCDLFIPTTGLLSEETLQRDISKLLVRYDERDNAVLDGATQLESVVRKNNKEVELVANTIIPTGGMYTDGMGLEHPNTLTRLVKACAIVQEEGNLLSVWVSSPLDEWQKPVSAFRLRQIYESIRLEA